MRKRYKVALGVTALCLLSVPIVLAHGVGHLLFTSTALRLRDLSGLLSELEWDADYERNVFDCSNMAASLADTLEDEGYRCSIAIDNNHAWVLVRTVEGIQSVEPTTLALTRSGRIPWYVIHPSVSIVTSPLAEMRYSGDELVEKGATETIEKAAGD